MYRKNVLIPEALIILRKSQCQVGEAFKLYRLYSPEKDAKTLMLKTPHTLVVATKKLYQK